MVDADQFKNITHYPIKRVHYGAELKIENVPWKFKEIPSDINPRAGAKYLAEQTYREQCSLLQNQNICLHPLQVPGKRLF